MAILTNLDIAAVLYNGQNIPLAGGGSPTLQTKSKTYTPSTSQQTESVTADSGYDGLSVVNVTVNAMPSGTAGTPVATKGTVSNHSVSITPSVTNSSGYISGGTKTGTAVSVSASELDSGTKSITSNGNNQDVVGYAAVNVNVPNSYSSSDEGKVVSNGALVAQGSDTVTQNGTVDTTLIKSLTVNVPTGGVSWDDIASRSEPSGDITLTGTTIGDYAFAYRRGSNRWRAFCPNVTNMGQNAFRECPYLTEVHLPKMNTYHATGYAFYGNTRLQIVDYGVMSPVRGNTFTNCTAFNTLILRKSDAIAPLLATATFNGTCFKNGGSGGTIYIPKVLYDHLGDGTALDYKAATNWSTVDGYGTITWAKIEGSAYELS